jgi:streptogramin lyase
VAYAVTREEPSRPAPRDEPTPLSEVVVQVDPEGEPPIVDTIPVPFRGGGPGVTLPTSPHSMVVGQGGVWTVRFRTLFHVDPSRSEVRTRLQLEMRGVPFSMNLAVGSDKVWIAYDGGFLEVNPATDEQRRVMTLETPGAATAADVVVGEGFVWVGLGDGRLVRLDPATGRDRTRMGLDPIDTIAFGHGSVWTADTVGGTVTRYDPETMRVEATIEVAAGLDYLVSGDAAVWASLGAWDPLPRSTSVRTSQRGPCRWVGFRRGSRPGPGRCG